MTVNDGGGLFDTEGLLGELLVILNDLEVKGAANARKLWLVASGIQSAKEAVHKDKERREQERKEWEEALHEQGHTVEREDL